VVVLLVLIVFSVSLVGAPPTVSRAQGEPGASEAQGPSEEARRALAFIAQREAIAAGDLLVVTDFERAAPLLGRAFQAVTIFDSAKGRSFDLLVDRQSGQFEERADIERAEQQARWSQYGRLEPALYDRLQELKDDDTLTVLLWTAAGAGQRLDQVEQTAQAALAAKYPEVRAALDRGASPLAVTDDALSNRINKEYLALIEAVMARRREALVKTLTEQGIATTRTEGLPAITATLPKRAILALAQRADIGKLALMEGEVQLLLDSAVQSNRAVAVRNRGYDGTGVDVAILEPDNVDFDLDNNNGAGTLCPAGTHNCFLHPGAVRPVVTPTFGPYFHATLVASAVASNHQTYRGMAPGATIIDAGMSGTSELHAVEALTWALYDQNVDIVNASIGDCAPSSDMQVLDQAFDYYARSASRLVVVAAGNRGSTCPNDYIQSPAKGWNVLSVGAYDDIGNIDWSGDVWAGSFSQWKDSASDDRDKPEVVAPGVTISGVGVDGKLALDNAGQIPSGTSFAAPQVAGEAALLMHRNAALYRAPTPLKAIIMASATHNVEGPFGIPTGSDLVDGAGGINADLAFAPPRPRSSPARPATSRAGG
jgi:subtilisin family serine protease